MGNCFHKKDEDGEVHKHTHHCFKKNSGEEIPQAKPRVVEVTLPTPLPAGDLSGVDPKVHRETEEHSLSQHIFHSGVLRWNQDPSSGLQKRLSNHPEDAKFKELHEEVDRYVQKLQLGMPVQYGDTIARSINVGTAHKSGETLVVLHDQESSLGIKVTLEEGHTVETAKAEVHSKLLIICRDLQLLQVP
jgi:hypothetical protein